MTGYWVQGTEYLVSLLHFFRVLRRHLRDRGLGHFHHQIVGRNAQMDGIVFQRHYRAAQPSARGDPISGLELIQHRGPFFLAPLLRHDQQKIKNPKNENERRYPQPPHTPATAELYRQQTLHNVMSERMYPGKPPALFGATGAVLSPRSLD